MLNATERIEHALGADSGIKQVTAAHGCEARRSEN